MKIIMERSLRDFEFWGGAVKWTELLTNSEFDVIEDYFKEIFPPFDYDITETFINDIFWFEFTVISSYLWNIDDEEEAWVYLNQRRMQT